MASLQKGTGMRTLDEVIKAHELCIERIAEGKDNCPVECPFVHCCDPEGGALKQDALRYLREYRRYQNTPSRIGHMAMVDLEDNQPLTWDELRTMEGKPVWLEAESLSIGVSPYWKDWYIIKSFSDDEFMRCNDGYEWAKEMQGRMWQAYRKENEDGRKNE